jgi:hypothetical protein
MSPMIPASERIIRARALIQQARDFPLPDVVNAWYDFSYVAQVKALLMQARDLVKFIPLNPSATLAIKKEVNNIYIEADQAHKEIFHKE